MKKLKKLFKLLPAMCLAVLSGLSVVLFKDHALSSSYAYYQTLKISTSQYEYSDINSNYSGLTIPNRFTTLKFNTSMTLSNNVLDNGNVNGQRVTLSGSCYLSNNVFGVYDFEFSNSQTTTKSLFDGHTYEFKLFRIQFVYVDNQLKCQLYFKGFSDGVATTGELSTVTYVSSPSYVNSADMPTNAYWNVLGLTNDYLLVSSMNYNSSDTSSSYDAGFADGYGTGYGVGYDEGTSYGSTNGYNNGYQVGYTEGVESQQESIDEAYNNGFSAGYNDGFSADSTTATIFSGILQVGMLPVNVLLAIFNFEILGINLSAFISAILTVCLTVIVIRTVTGGKNSE